jgi:hypothetical protein
MIFDDVDFSQLPPSGEDAFVYFEKKIRKSYEQYSRNDRENQNNYDNNGNYCGSYSPERDYLNAIITFIDEYNLDLDVPDISSLHDEEFLFNFEKIKSQVSAYILRISLRKQRIGQGSIGTLIYIETSYKSEIGQLLETIRKIVNQNVQDIKKKDKIFSKIASLQSEVDRERTTADAAFITMIDLSSALGECAENLEPAISKLERIKKLFWDNSKKVDMLPKKERQKLISQNDNSLDSDDELEDEIPF